MCEPCTPDALLEAVRGLWLTDPGLGPKPLLAKLREQQPDLGAATKEVREALAVLKAESEASQAAAAQPAADETAAAARAPRRAHVWSVGTGEGSVDINFSSHVRTLHARIPLRGGACPASR